MENPTSKPFQYGVFIGEEKPGETKILRRPNLVDKPLLSDNHLCIDTLYGAFENARDHFPNKQFLGTRKKLGDDKYGNYEWKSYAEVDELSKLFCKGITKNDFCPEVIEEDQKFKFFGIYSKNREEWVIADFACQLNSITVVTVYDTLGLGALEYIFNQTSVMTLLLESNALGKIALLKSEGKTGSVKNIILLDNKNPTELEKCRNNGLNIFTYQQILNDGKDYQMEFNKSKGDTILTFCYTSGTTGNPKGAMIPNRALMTGMYSMDNIGFRLNETDYYLSFLPLAHIMEKLIFTCNVYGASAIGFYSGNIAKLAEDAVALRPTFFCGVPRVFQKMYDKIMSNISKLSGIKKKIAEKAIKEKLADHEKYGKVTHPVWDRLIFNKTKAALGGNLRWMLVGSAPIPSNIIKFLRIALCTPIIEGYGQTENCANALISHVSDNSAGHLGGPTCGCEIKLIDVPELNYYSTDINPITKIPEPKGEICVRGPIVFKAYYKDKKKTEEAIDSEGWLHSGDIGKILYNQGNAVAIIDRVKNIFKLSQGEYIAPEKIEQFLIQSRYVSQMFIHGESLYSFLVAIIVPEKQKCIEFLNSKRIETTMRDIDAHLNNKMLKKAVVTDLDEIGRRNDLKGFELIKKVFLCAEPFSIDNNLLTPTMKLKVNEAKKKFQKQIEDMYAEDFEG